ncbi:MAG: gliding motility-associated C-terminal domain-containing protein [Cryomorphaceae bacterium]|nr:gliding motility-associated C-terminal domain-containing protein [Cryomorphaceae bacterium]
MITTTLMAHEEDPVFLPNHGQWEQHIIAQTPLNSGHIYYESTRIRFQLRDPEFTNFWHDRHNAIIPEKKFQTDSEGNFIINEHTYDLSWVGGNRNPNVVTERPTKTYRNYFIGSDKSKWATEVKEHRRVVYKDIYQGVDFRWYAERGHLKYDFRVQAGQLPDDIALVYSGLDGLENIDGKLHMRTSLGTVVELEPFAYQIKNGVYYKVNCRFNVNDSLVTFDLGTYDQSYDLVIDPTVVFSSFSASVADNWGFTATYDNDGRLYAGGMVFGSNYPTNTGAYQTTYGGGNTDVSIFVFSPDGSTLEYSTFLGGNNSEQPHSMIVTPSNELVVFGTTSSINFPTLTTAWQSSYGGGSLFILPGYTFNNGSDIFITKFNATGTTLIGSTFFGGNGNDGINLEILRNYGDYARGEVFLDSLDNVYIASTTFSNIVPLTNAAFPAQQGGSDALLLKFNPNLTNLEWGTFYGGFGHDAAYTVRIDGDDVFIAGGTFSPNLPMDSLQTGFQPIYGDSVDGFIAKFDRSTGNFINATYIGTASYDQIFNIDTDRNGNLYALGQTKGTFPHDTTRFGNPDGKHFISKFTPDLTSRLWNINFGSSSGYLCAPTAFEVDNCNAILFGMWGGESNNPSPFFNNMVPSFNGFTDGLPVTSNAFKITTDGSDLYFCALSADATTLEFGTFYGGTANEHVDGGTSRFSPEGIIYQAVCAACGAGNFPTTPGVYGPNNLSFNCNKAGIKIDFDRSVEANADVDVSTELDSLCDGFLISFSNASNNANAYFWDFGDGQTSTDSTPTVLLVGPNTYNVMLVAIDTNCFLYDTVYIQVEVESFIDPVAALEVDYFDCDSLYEVNFFVDTTLADYVEWVFGDGVVWDADSVSDTTYFYSGPGVYSGFMVAHDTICGQTDTAFFEVEFIEQDFTFPDVDTATEECLYGQLFVDIVNDSLMRERYSVRWRNEDTTVTGRSAMLPFKNDGLQPFSLIIRDNWCNTTFVKELWYEFDPFGEELSVPNVFTPNQDGKNDLLELRGDPCATGTEFRVLNRWGQTMFYTTKPFEEFWDGVFENRPASEGTYYYMFKMKGIEKSGSLQLFR